MSALYIVRKAQKTKLIYMFITKNVIFYYFFGIEIEKFDL